ncbi:pilus assembly protein TadG-related protein [Pseudonocardia sp. MH-G8]|uniref:pilus assembly protein TadG-related protein n=1 Tax=Pseudonocardia sp. MH-G8 TaxID=1854588 RepID=UPI0026BB9A6A
MTPRSRFRLCGTAWWRADDGRVTAFVVVLMTGILALAGLGLDGGLALAAKVRAVGQAEAAARAGAQAVDLDAYRATGRLVLDEVLAVAAARTQLAAAGADGKVWLRDGGVVVRVTATHVPRLLGLAGITEMTVSGEARAVPQGGVGTAEP